MKTKIELIEEVLRLDGNVMTSEQIGIAKSLIRDLKAQRDMAVEALESMRDYGDVGGYSVDDFIAKIKSDEWVG